MSKSNAHPCPACGHCPTCGRSNTAPYPQFIPVPYYPPYPRPMTYPTYPAVWSGSTQPLIGQAPQTTSGSTTMVNPYRYSA